jgi:hypothetical protein
LHEYNIAIAVGSNTFIKTLTHHYVNCNGECAYIT